ncbi:MAG TPA: CD225/dispanin family protein [Thermoanaerobaculia bacterium]
MNCPHCGTSNLDTATICANCGRPLTAAQATYMPPPPPPQGSYQTGMPGAAAAPGAVIPNYLLQSILVTLCCCLPLGVVAIIFSAQVNTKLAAGDIAGARDASSKAKLFAWIGLGVGLVAIVLIFLINGAAFLAAVRNASAH